LKVIVDEEAVELFCSLFFGFLLLIIISSLLHTHLPLPHEVNDSPDHAARYDDVSPQLRTSSLIQKILGRRVEFVALHTIVL
jgi:hypothetical protein